MKAQRLLFIFLALILFSKPGNSQTQNTGNPSFGIGLRLGDPSGVSFKKYFSKNALELSIGRSYMFYGRPRYYDRHFNRWYEDHRHIHPRYKEVRYLGGERGYPVSFQLHYLIQKKLKGLDNLNWYWGIGAQLRYHRYYFDYEYKIEGVHGRFYTSERISNLDVGIDIPVGLEYTLKEAPLSFFGDINLFMEVMDNPFVFWLQGGIGIRYNF